MGNTITIQRNRIDRPETFNFVYTHILNMMRSSINTIILSKENYMPSDMDMYNKIKDAKRPISKMFRYNYDLMGWESVNLDKFIASADPSFFLQMKTKKLVIE